MKVRKNSTCEAPKQIRERSKLPGLQQCRTGRERHTHSLALARSLSRPHPQSRDARGPWPPPPKQARLRFKRSLFLQQHLKIERDRLTPATGAAPPATGAITAPSKKPQARGEAWQDGSTGGARGGVRPCLGGAGREGQCIRPGRWAGPGGERTGKGRALRPGAWGDDGAMMGLNAPLRGQEEREKAQGTLWGGAAPRDVEPGRYHRAEWG